MDWIEGWVLLVSFCKHGNEPTGLVKGG